MKIWYNISSIKLIERKRKKKYIMKEFLVIFILFDFSLRFCQVFFKNYSNINFFYGKKKCKENFCVGQILVNYTNNKIYPIILSNFEIESRKTIAYLCNSMMYDSLYSFGMECDTTSYFLFI